MANCARWTTRRRLGCIIGALLAAATVGGCSDGDDSSASAKPTKSTQSTPPSKSKKDDRPEHIPGESVTEAPRLPEGEALAEVATAKGNQEVPLRRIAKGPLSVLVNCQGKGTLKVTVKPMGMSFPLECVDGEVSSTYNELGLKKARPKGTVTVEAASTVRWSLTIGQ